MKNLSKNVNLVKINLDSNKIAAIDYNDIKHLVNLKSLWLNENFLTDINQILVSLQKLEELYIAKN